MANIDPAPDAGDARRALDQVAVAQRYVRDTPWPWWLHVGNAVLLGLLAWSSATAAPGLLLLVAGGLVGWNVVVASLLGLPWALPTSTGFLVCVGLATACVAAAALVGAGAGGQAAAPLLTLGATGSYLVGAHLHRRAAR